jgi:pimeloyl-ACP methyl ester carboxylesterase
VNGKRQSLNGRYLLMVDLGSGPPLVLIPGIQGRWEWMRPTVDALAARCRVITASLAGDPGAGDTVDPVRGFASFVDQVDRLREKAGLDRVALCGVSYGGYVALQYAATYPSRVAALVIASSPGPGWRLSPRHRRYVRWPRLMAPAFAGGAPARLGPEIAAAHDGAWPALRFTAAHLRRVVSAMPSPARMSERVRLAQQMDFRAACQAIRVPTLVLTGEAQLDRVVPVRMTLEYLRAIEGARAAVLPRTGHIGCVTRPHEFASIVGSFIEECEQ